jgi:hypothetical protein
MEVHRNGRFIDMKTGFTLEKFQMVIDGNAIIWKFH